MKLVAGFYSYKGNTRNLISMLIQDGWVVENPRGEQPKIYEPRDGRDKDTYHREDCVGHINKGRHLVFIANTGISRALRSFIRFY
jgi:hypothetical protein